MTPRRKESPEGPSASDFPPPPAHMAPPDVNVVHRHVPMPSYWLCRAYPSLPTLHKLLSHTPC